MKLSEAKPYYETSGEMEEQFFSIQDQGMIFDILRNKMYSNPILAICREISCNARDAHREVGKADVPIEIHLPNNLDPHFRIKDFGPGISPDRMSNVFIKYTASTKRNDNIQTGGFGLGAKTPFSYSDTFAITTVVDGMKYSYSCAIDSTRVGKLTLFNSEPTTESNGTTIEIPVKPADFNAFTTWIEQACRHWEVRPVVKGGTINWVEIKKILEGKNWAIMSSNDWQRNAKMVIDGIEYPLELDTLRKYADAKLIDAARGHFIMYFGVGELSLSASREQIYLDKPTQDKIRQRLDEIHKEIKQKVVDKIDAFPNLWDANVFYRKELHSAFQNINFLGKLSWKGIDLHSGYIDVNCSCFTFTKGHYSRKTGNDPNKIKRSTGRSLAFNENSALYVNDLPIKEPTPRHVKKAFEDNPKLESVQVICPNDKVTLADLNKSIYLDKMGSITLSSITKATGRAYTPAASRLLIFKFDAAACAFRQVSYDSMDEDINSKVICNLKKETSYSSVTRSVILANKKILSLTALQSLQNKNPKYSIYGVDDSTPQDRIDEEFSDFESIDDFIDEKVLNNKTINYVEIKFATIHNYHLDERLLKNYTTLSPLIDDKNSVFLKRLELHKKIKQLNEGDLGLLQIYESVNGEISTKDINAFTKANPDWDLDKINKEYEQKYPLLPVINTYNYQQIVKHIAHYVNLIDKI